MSKGYTWRRRLAIVASSGLMFSIGGVAVTTVAASAHTPVVTKDCGKLAASASGYDTGGQNRLKVLIDNVVRFDQPFGASKSFAVNDLTKYESHSYVVQVTAYNDPANSQGNGPNGWTKRFTGSIAACQTQTTPATPTATTPTCDQPNITVTPSTQDGVTWNPNTPTVLTPGQSVSYTASPSDSNHVFPSGTQTVFPFTNNFDTETCTVLSPTGSIKTACSGAITFNLDNTASNVPATFETVVGGVSKSFTVKAGAIKKVISHGKPGTNAVLYGPGDVRLAHTKVPKACAVSKPAGSIKTFCTGQGEATLNNVRSNVTTKYTLVAITPSRRNIDGAISAWNVNVKGGHKRYFSFKGHKFPVGTVLKVKVPGKTLDKAKVGKRCNVPHNPPDTGMRQSARSSAMHLVVPAIGANARVVPVGLTKGGSLAVGHSVRDVFLVA